MAHATCVAIACCRFGCGRRGASVRRKATPGGRKQASLLLQHATRRVLASSSNAVVATAWKEDMLLLATVAADHSDLGRTGISAPLSSTLAPKKHSRRIPWSRCCSCSL